MDQSDVVIDASGVRTGAAITVIHTIKRSVTVGMDRTSAFFMMRMDISICNRDRQVNTRAQEDKNSRTLLQQFAFVSACMSTFAFFSRSLLSLSPSLPSGQSVHTPLRRGVCVYTLILS